jgi:hypothetical protein
MDSVDTMAVEQTTAAQENAQNVNTTAAVAKPTTIKKSTKGEAFYSAFTSQVRCNYT